MRTLVSFSGGLDSTYVLWKLLATTDDEVTAVFFDDRYQSESDFSGRTRPEISGYQEIVVNNIAEWLKTNVRGFSLEKKNIISFAEDETREIYAIRNYAAPLINNNQADRIAFGNVWIPLAQRRAAGIPEDILKLPMVSHAAYRAFESAANRGSIYFPLAEKDIGKATIISEMPMALQNLSVSCISPLVDSMGSIISCGVCKKCKDVQFFRTKLGEGIPPLEVENLRNVSRRSGDSSYRAKLKEGIWENVSESYEPPFYRSSG